MIIHLTVLLTFQLIGEALSRSLSLPLPGPVIGMALLFATLVAIPKVAKAITPTVRVLLAHLSLLFVPAGVGVIGHLDLLGANGPALAIVILGSTALTILASVGSFLLVARFTGQQK